MADSSLPTKAPKNQPITETANSGIEGDLVAIADALVGLRDLCFRTDDDPVLTGRGSNGIAGILNRLVRETDAVIEALPLGV